jgi:hypothetical protein
MLRVILASSLLLPLCSGCTCCAKVADFLLNVEYGDEDPEYDRQAALNQKYQAELKSREEKAKSWSVSALP